MDACMTVNIHGRCQAVFVVLCRSLCPYWPATAGRPVNGQVVTSPSLDVQPVVRTDSPSRPTTLVTIRCSLHVRLNAKLGFTFALSRLLPSRHATTTTTTTTFCLKRRWHDHDDVVLIWTYDVVESQTATEPTTNTAPSTTQLVSSLFTCPVSLTIHWSVWPHTGKLVRRPYSLTHFLASMMEENRSLYYYLAMLVSVLSNIKSAVNVSLCVRAHISRRSYS